MNATHLIDALILALGAAWCVGIGVLVALTVPLGVAIVVCLILIGGAVAAFEEARESWREAKR